MKKKFLYFIFMIIAIFGTLCIIDHHRMNNNEAVVFSTWGKKYAPSLKEEVDPNAEQSFVGKVLEETTTYMIVEPAEDEYERTITQRMMIAYSTDHIDYLYGTDRLVVIYYNPAEMIKGGAMPIIKTDDISVEGFREWELKINPTEIKGYKTLAVAKRDETDNKTNWFRQYNLYYYNIGDVIVAVDGKEYPLAHALKLGKITMSAILAKANQDVSDGVIEEISYDDGGSSVFKYPDYTIVKYHTLDGNDDMYIGSPDIDIHVKDK